MLFGADSWLEDLDTSPSCKDLGQILDSHLSFNDHMDYLSSSLFSKLCQINRVRHLFTKGVLSVILHCLEQQNRSFLQNLAARVLTGERKYDHISPSLKELSWRNISEML